LEALYRWIAYEEGDKLSASLMTKPAAMAAGFVMRVNDFRLL
jgi:hypothetical protein